MDLHQPNSKAQLHYIFINKEWISSTMNCEEAYSSFERVSSDHRIFLVKICVSLTNLRRNKTQTVKASQYN